jgi:hypothetical protein
MNIETELDSDTLRDRPVDPEALTAATRQTRDQIDTLRDTLRGHPAGDVSAGDDDDTTEFPDEETRLEITRLARQLNRLRDYLALGDQRTEALCVGSEGLGIWETLRRTKAIFLAQLRTAELAADLLDHDRPMQTLDQLVDRSTEPRFRAYRGFALETRATCRWRRGEEAGAFDDIDACLKIRLERGVDRLIARTETIQQRITASNT